MGVNSLPKTVTRQRRGCDLNPGRSASESSTQTTRLPSHPPSIEQQRNEKHPAESTAAMRNNCAVSSIDKKLCYTAWDGPRDALC